MIRRTDRKLHKSVC